MKALFTVAAKLVGICAYITLWGFAYAVAIGVVLALGVLLVTGGAWMLLACAYVPAPVRASEGGSLLGVLLRGRPRWP